MSKNITDEATLLKNWYLENFRALPWRLNKDPYRIWISEMMLQQTTVAAVVPYYERFLTKFPSVELLKKAPLTEVLELWSGLGYYSRARNIHKAAQHLGEHGFPQSYQDLMELPGFGPYTARAVSSLAFGERVGVVDGNVIRVLSRYYGMSLPWWNNSERQKYQSKADALVEKEDPSIINQSLMELGATICTPQSPACFLCPIKENCQARLLDKIGQWPLKKPKKSSEVWVWDAEVPLRGNKVGLIENDYLPFLKGQWIFPGTVTTQTDKPKKFDVKHGITHHEIFVRVKRLDSKAAKKLRWVQINELKQINPSSLLRKVLESQKISSLR